MNSVFVRGSRGFTRLQAEVIRRLEKLLRVRRRATSRLQPMAKAKRASQCSKPNDQAAALIWLLRKYPGTLKRLESLNIPA